MKIKYMLVQTSPNHFIEDSVSLLKTFKAKRISLVSVFIPWKIVIAFKHLKEIF